MNKDHHVILRVVAKIVIPLIAVYAFYIQFHADYGAGGGFQAGVTLAVAMILYALVFGVPAAMKAVPPWFSRTLAALGVVVYAGTGVATLLNGGNYLGYDVLSGDPAAGYAGQKLGIKMIELGVLMTVSGSMLTIFYAFAGRVAEIRDEDW